MDDRLIVAREQLARMRGMTGMYHRRFFFDINLATVLTVALLLIGWWSVEEAFLLVPVVALMGAVATAFDASYLMFARWYAAFLEADINDRVGSNVLVAAELESAYLFELGTPKIVTIPLGGPFTWFSFVTLLYTTVGVLAYGFGLALGWNTLLDAPTAAGVVYLAALFGLTSIALITGIWWFGLGVGERRLKDVLEERYGHSLGSSG